MNHSIDLKFRPRSYFWAKAHGIQLLSDIKGANRRLVYEQALELDDVSELDPAISSHALDETDRKDLGQLHPWFMGGEYLPNAQPKEVEIARITIASTTQDVTSVYARPLGKRIAYRIVDEYGGETLSGVSARTSMLALTLGELVKFFISGWELLVVLDCNFDKESVPRHDIHSFILDASSSFYPEFGEAISANVNAWLDEESV